MEGAAGVNDGLGRQSVERAAQAIAWEDWVPLEGGAQFAQGLHFSTSQHRPARSSIQSSYLATFEHMSSSSLQCLQTGVTPCVTSCIDMRGGATW